MSGDDLLGWITHKLVRHDRLAPGLIQRILQTSPLDRQAVYAALARLETDTHRSDTMNGALPAHQPLSLVLRDGSPREIITAVYGVSPGGFLGALDRCGFRPLKPTTYGLLYGMFDPAERRRARCLHYLGSLNDDKIEALAELQGALLTPRVLPHVRDGEAARKLNQTIAFLRQVNSALTEQTLTEALR